MLSLGFLLLLMNGVQSEEMNDHPCCPQIFLQSSGVLGSTQSSVLGIYTISNQKLANTPHPVYTKSEEETQFHVYFRVKSYGPQGWVVGGDLLEDSFYIATGQSTLDCPDGIVGGLYGENQTVVDEKFSIECHSDQVKIPCCESVNVSATGVIGENQGGSLGLFKESGDHNGHTLYKGGYMSSYLYYRKAGSGPDGWVISTHLDENMLMVTTRAKEYCPDTIRAGYDRDEEKDTTLSIICVVEDDYVQDPGVSTVPLEEKLKEESTVRSNTAALNLLAFRLFTILYILVINQ